MSVPPNALSTDDTLAKVTPARLGSSPSLPELFTNVQQLLCEQLAAPLDPTANNLEVWVAGMAEVFISNGVHHA